MAKETYYFSHDSNALSDVKILNMRADYKMEGYGLYWAIIEMLRNEENFKLPLDKSTYRAIQMQTQPETIDIEQYINDCIYEFKDNVTGVGLFKTDNKYFWSESLLNRMNLYKQKSKKRSEAGKKGAEKRWRNNSNAIKNDNKTIANAITLKGKWIANVKKSIAKNSKRKESKVKENKINKSKVNKNKYGEFQKVRLTDDEYNKLIIKLGNRKTLEYIDRLDGYIASKGKKYSNHYATILNWYRRDSKENSAKEEFLNG